MSDSLPEMTNNSSAQTEGLNILIATLIKCLNNPFAQTEKMNILGAPITQTEISDNYSDIITAQPEKLASTTIALTLSKYDRPEYFYDLTSGPLEKTFLERLFNTFGSNNFCLFSGFVLGILFTLRDRGTKQNNNFVANPLKLIFDTSVNGFIGLSIIKFLMVFMPTKFRIAIPLTTLATCVYFKIHKLSIKPTEDK